MHFNPHTLPALLCLTLALFCGAFVIGHNSKALLNRIFFLICITIAAWCSFYIPFNFNAPDHVLLWWFRVSYCFISFLPIMTFTFVSTYLNAPKNLFWLRINTLIGLTFSILSLTTNWMIEGVYHQPWYPYPKAGPAHLFLIAHCIYLVSWSFLIMLPAFKDPDYSPKRLNHIKYMLFAIAVLSCGMWDFLGNYNVGIYPIGCFTSILYLIIVTTAIVRHQLMDIQIVLRKSLVYSLLISFITLIYLLIVFIFEQLFHSYIGYKTFTGSLLTATFIAIIFIPLKNKLQNFTDKVLFKNTTVEIAHENELLRSEVAQTEKFKAIATLASGIAHEIKNPLTAIQTFNEHLPNKKNDPEFFAKYHRIVTQETKRINAMLQELLTFAKPCPPQLESVDPNKILSEIITLVEQNCATNKVVIVKQFETSTLIQADPNQLKQALLNIILNAIDAMPDGGSLTIASTAPVRQGGKQSQYIITITDTGCGINPKDLPHIFEPFYTKKEKGTGLGLSITQGIIEKHGGKIHVSSKTKQGTTFTISLP